MKYSHIILLFFTFHSYSQITKFDESIINSMLIGKWNIEKVILDGENATLTKIFKNNSIEFFENRKFIEYPTNETSARGIWSYNSEKKLIELKDNDKIIGVIKSLEKNYMIFEPLIEKDELTLNKNYEMYFTKSQ